MIYFWGNLQGLRLHLKSPRRKFLLKTTEKRRTAQRCESCQNSTCLCADKLDTKVLIGLWSDCSLFAWMRFWFNPSTLNFLPVYCTRFNAGKTFCKEIQTLQIWWLQAPINSNCFWKHLHFLCTKKSVFLVWFLSFVGCYFWQWNFSDRACRQTRMRSNSHCCWCDRPLMAKYEFNESDLAESSISPSAGIPGLQCKQTKKPTENARDGRFPWIRLYEKNHYELYQFTIIKEICSSACRHEMSIFIRSQIII